MKLLSISLLIVFLFSASSAFATSDTISFGGSLGLIYSPNTLSVHVGDTIVWDGTITLQTFEFHPLESTMRPAGADSIGMNTGWTYSYVVKMPGTYKFQCFYHSGSGMKGTITAVKADVKPEDQQNASSWNYPNPFSSATTIHYELTDPSVVNLDVFDLSGKEIYHLSGFQEAGLHDLLFKSGDLSSGTYLYRIKTGNAVIEHRMVLTR